jgi:hypothetical protein
VTRSIAPFEAMESSLNTNWLRSYERKESNRAACFSMHIAQRFYRFRRVYSPESIPLIDTPAAINTLSLFGNFIPSAITSKSTTTSLIPTSITAQLTSPASSHQSATTADLNSEGVRLLRNPSNQMENKTYRLQRPTRGSLKYKDSCILSPNRNRILLSGRIKVSVRPNVDITDMFRMHNSSERFLSAMN